MQPSRRRRLSALLAAVLLAAPAVSRPAAQGPDAPTCAGLPATIYVAGGVIVGGPEAGRPYRGVLRGEPGAVIVGTPGKDRITGSGGVVICAGAGDDTIDTGRGDDWIDAGPGNDQVRSGSGDDVVFGGAGDDLLDGGDGDDYLDGGPGRDVLRGGSGRDVVLGGEGDDQIAGGDGDDCLEGGAGRDDVEGGAGNDAALGGEGDDALAGGGGGDYLHGGPGRDVLQGHAGVDTCVEGEVLGGCELRGDAAPPALGAPVATPSGLVAGQAVALTVTSAMPPGVPRAVCVKVTVVGADGRALRGVPMRDDGRKGDARAGDGLYTARVALLPQPPGDLALHVSGVFRDTSGPASAEVVTVPVTGTDTTAPALAVDAPAAMRPGSTGTVTAQVSDPAGISGVTLVVDGVPVQTLVVGPFVFALAAPANAPPGRLVQVEVRAIDGAGNVAQAQRVVTIAGDPDTLPPEVTLVGPATAVRGGGVLLTASARDDVQVAALALAHGAQPLGETTAAPFALDRAFTVPAGAAIGQRFRFTATARDASQNTGSATHDVEVVAVPDTTPPVIALTAPAEAPAGAVITARATVADEGGVRAVAFGDGGTFTAERTAPPYEVEYTVPPGASPGTIVVLTATARDFAGLTATAQAPVRVVDRTPPVVTLNAPARATPGSTVTLVAAATDDRGVAVLNLDDGRQTVAIGEPPFELRQPFTVPQTAVVGSTFGFTASAVDLAGNTGTATALLTVVDTPDTTPPSVTLRLPPTAAAGERIGLLADAHDDTGVRAVAFRRGAEAIAAVDVPPFAAAFTVPADAPAGTVIEITATASDFAGLEASDAKSLTVVDTPDTTPPAVGVTVAAEVLRGEAVPVAVQAQDDVGVATVRLLADGAPLASAAGGTLTATLSVPAGAPVGALIALRAEARDFAGNAGTGLATARVVERKTPVGRGFLAGAVYDDHTGLVLEGAAVTRPARPDPPRLTGALGLYEFQADAGPARLRVAKPGFTAVDRLVEVRSGLTARVFDARLTRLDDKVSVLSAALGGTASDLAGTVALTVAAGALAEDVEVRVTLVGGQGLQGRLPPGWSPALTVDVSPAGVPFSRPATFLVPNTAGSPADAGVVAALWDPGALQWIALAPGAVSADGAQVLIEVARTGQVAVLVPDVAPLAPPDPVAGQPLPAVGGELAAATAEVTPNPLVLFAGPGARSVVTARVTAAAPAPSASAIQARLSEAFTLFDGQRIVTDPYVQDLVVYRFPESASQQRLAAEFAVSPTRAFTVAELDLGLIGIEVSLPGAVATVPGAPIGPQGGAVLGAGGERLTIPAGALAQPGNADVVSLRAEDVGVPVPPGFTYAGGTRLTLPGTLSIPASLAVPAPAGAGPDDQYLVVQVAEVLGATRLLFVARAVVAGDALVTVLTAPPAPGVRAGGRYAVLRASEPVAFAAGTIRDAAGAPAGQAVARVDTLPFAARTDAAGGYSVPVALGAFQVTATDLGNRDEGRAAGGAGTKGQVVAVDVAIAATPPVVTGLAPVDGAAGVPRTAVVAATFSEPIEPASILADGAFTLTGPAGRVAADVGLSAGNTVATLFPRAPLPAETSFAVGLTEAVRDLGGRALAPFTSAFTTLDDTPPARPPAGQVTVRIPDAAGIAVVSGTLGSVEPGVRVIASNGRTQQTSAAFAGADGSFGVSLAMALGDVVLVTLEDAAGNRTSLGTDLAFVDDTGERVVIVGPAGGVVTGPGSVRLEVPPGALPGFTVVRVTPIAEADYPAATPAGFTFLGAVDVDLGGMRATRKLRLSVPAPPGTDGALDMIVARPIQAGPDVKLTPIGIARLEGDRVVTGPASELAARPAGRRAARRAPPAIREDRIVELELDLARPARIEQEYQAFPGVTDQAQLVFLLSHEVVLEAASIVAPFFPGALNMFIGAFPSFLYPYGRAPILALVPASQPLSIRFVGAAGEVIESVARPPAPPAPPGSPATIPATAVDGRPPRPARVSPFHDATGIDVGIAPRVVFSEPMDTASVRARLRLLDPADRPVAGEIAFEDADHTAVFVPAQRLKLATQYRLELRGASDVSGERLPDLDARFTTFAPALVGRLAPGPTTSLESVNGIDYLPSTRTLVVANGLQFGGAPPDLTGLLLIDVTDPANPRQIGDESPTSGRARDVMALGGVSLTGRTYLPGCPVPPEVHGDVAVIVSGSTSTFSNLRIYDVTTPGAPPLITPPDPCVPDGFLVGARLVASPLGVFEANQPAPNVPVALGIPVSVTAMGDVAYLATAGLGIQGVSLSRSVPLPRRTVPDQGVEVQARVEGTLARLTRRIEACPTHCSAGPGAQPCNRGEGQDPCADGFCEQSSNGPICRIVTHSPVQMNDLHAAAGKVLGAGGLAFQPEYLQTLATPPVSGQGLLIVDPSLDESTVQRVATPGGAVRVKGVASFFFDVDGNRQRDAGELFDLAFVGDGPAGLQIIDFSGRGEPRIVATVPTAPMVARDIALDPRANLAYVSADGFGIVVIDWSRPFQAARETCGNQACIDRDGDGRDDRILGVIRTTPGPGPVGLVGPSVLDERRGLLFVGAEGLSALRVFDVGVEPTCAPFTGGVEVALRGVDRLGFTASDVPVVKIGAARLDNVRFGPGGSTLHGAVPASPTQAPGTFDVTLADGAGRTHEIRQGFEHVAADARGIECLRQGYVVGIEAARDSAAAESPAALMDPVTLFSLGAAGHTRRAAAALVPFPETPAVAEARDELFASTQAVTLVAAAGLSPGGGLTAVEGTLGPFAPAVETLAPATVNPSCRRQARLAAGGSAVEFVDLAGGAVLASVARTLAGGVFQVLFSARACQFAVVVERGTPLASGERPVALSLVDLSVPAPAARVVALALPGGRSTVAPGEQVRAHFGPLAETPALVEFVRAPGVHEVVVYRAGAAAPAAARAGLPGFADPRLRTTLGNRTFVEFSTGIATERVPL